MKTTVRPFDNGRGVQIRTKQPFMLSKNGIIGLTIPPSVVLAALKTCKFCLALHWGSEIALNSMFSGRWTGQAWTSHYCFPSFLTSHPIATWKFHCAIFSDYMRRVWNTTSHLKAGKYIFRKRPSLKGTSRISDESLKQTPRHQKTISTLLINIFACIVLIKFGF